jgi:hypothetical protein
MLAAQYRMAIAVRSPAQRLIHAAMMTMMIPARQMGTTARAILSAVQATAMEINVKRLSHSVNL